ncbi:hypothetical protein HPB51_017642 [Rhipicephalus microplus]|uniref:Uncharacterized protein n=1 Tax=Rhipicephalus microplus TaxID=6941 RepID=A0A9J6E2H1_RHIMP|nr:hypothetical protein HPB51_017642 [Rhipicephalus microplus]
MSTVVTFCNAMSAGDTATAKVWQAGLRSITNNIKANNVCPATCLEKQKKVMQSVYVHKSFLGIALSSKKPLCKGKTSGYISRSRLWLACNVIVHICFVTILARPNLLDDLGVR